MGILPVFPNNLNSKDIPSLYFKEEYENETESDLYARIFNNDIIEKINWLHGSRGKYGNSNVKKPYRKHYWWPPIQSEWSKKDYISLSDRYQDMTQVINSSPPILKHENMYSRYRKTPEDWFGKYILTSEMMEILGPGIYISLSCTPFVDERSIYLKKEYIQYRHVIDRNIKLKIFENIISKILNPCSFLNWKKIFKKKKKSLRNNKRYKLQVERDIDSAITKTTSMAIGFREKTKKTKKKKV